ncbi:FAD-dependent oxidoreductase [Candidatus Berkelbacteria bacterium]|nr:FAD-dependent oxidoreductase [Candidatus Berkelbacteria bacterium]
MRCRTVKLINIAQEIFELEITKPLGFDFIAGQYVDLQIINPKLSDNMGDTRSLSILSSPNDPTIKFLFKQGITAFKNNLKNLKEGDELSITQPKGKFTCKDVAKSVFIAGGVGVAPILSIIRTQTSIPKAGLFSFSTNDSAPYLEEIKKYGKIFITKEKSKFINRRINTNDLAPYRDKEFYICGSSAFISGVLLMLENLKIEESKIKTEDFIGY